MSDGSFGAAPDGGSPGDVLGGGALGGSPSDAMSVGASGGGKPSSSPLKSAEELAKWPSLKSAWIYAWNQKKRLEQALLRAQKRASDKQNTALIVELHSKIALAQEVLDTITALLARM